MELCILCRTRFLFDLIYVILTDVSNFSSVNIFMIPSQNGSVIPIDIVETRQYNVKVYCLKTHNTDKGQYEHVVCNGESLVQNIKANIPIEIVVEAYDDRQIPIEVENVENKGTLPVTIHRYLPPYYIVEANHQFSTVLEFLIFIQHNTQLKLFNLRGDYLRQCIPFELPSASRVRCKVFGTCLVVNHFGKYLISKTISRSAVAEFKTYLSLADNYRLFNLAVTYSFRTGIRGLQPISFFYRNKSEEYFDIIRYEMDGKMFPYLKSNGGEQGSVLNERIRGLFFSTFTDPNTSQPHSYSYYGPIRLYVEAKYLFHPQCNLYFADFYCHNIKHHVTIVLTPKSSNVDAWCSQYLLKLDTFYNPYLCLRQFENGAFVVLANMDVIVEVFYTEVVDISFILLTKRGFMKKVQTMGRGYALQSGVPKNVCCSICNL